ncbi:hypothetical protein CK203_036125 [Vitis vinifera]|uniref:Uncharacterized protein n=1 Tax=Vitis vinifera TaxID=29760 RepID=A0A438IWM5_VITVI|nr:hypothetical protein CK203_036125 [Vitis vinifera]
MLATSLRRVGLRVLGDKCLISFFVEDLVELDMRYSSLTQLWENDTLLEKLNTVRLSCSQYLIEIPDISIRAPNLEKLILDGCSSLLMFRLDFFHSFQEVSYNASLF